MPCKLSTADFCCQRRPGYVIFYFYARSAKTATFLIVPLFSCSSIYYFLYTYAIFYFNCLALAIEGMQSKQYNQSISNNKIRRTIQQGVPLDMNKFISTSLSNEHNVLSIKFKKLRNNLMVAF
ncbi:hypothetical protein T09_11567 [Trichinella sp. T9]|nr:hypothetical protein T09_11567 [Trichinella sp. T9]